jgi:hypothetical protein
MAAFTPPASTAHFMDPAIESKLTKVLASSWK